MIRPALVSALLSLVFIARTTFVVDGVRYATLFDDAMISMRYARNLAGGHGLVWNVGQPAVEGYTNFLWTLWMALIHLLPIPESKIALAVMATGGVILLTMLGVVRAIARELAPAAPRAASCAVWMTALYYPLIYWTLRGMEVGLVTLIVSTAVLLALRLGRRYRRGDLIALAVLMAFGALTRIDVLVPCGVVAAYVLFTAGPRERRTVAGVLCGVVVGALALHTLVRLRYYGDPLPNTYYLKVSGAAIGTRLARGLRGLTGIFMLHLAVPTALAAAYLSSGRRRVSETAPRADRGAFLLAAIFAAACAYSAYVGGDAWDAMFYANRYITPAVPGLLILAALAIDRALAPPAMPRAVAIGVAALFLVVAALTAVAPAVTLGLHATSADVRLRAVRALLTLAPVLVLPAAARSRALAAAALTAALVVAVNGLGFSVWLVHNAFYVDDDEWATRYGLALQAATAEDASIAVTWAGAIPYFSHRTTVDLLGKSDRIVAARPRQPREGFNPGHDKWDYAYSIGQLRPDVVAQLWHASDEEVRAIANDGYTQLAPWAFTRADSRRVDTTRVSRAACAVLAGDPFVLGSMSRFPDDLDGLLRRYCR